MAMNYSNDFPILKKYHYLDNASSSLKPKQVVDKMSEYYLEYGVNVHRGIYEISERATEEYENVRSFAAKFFNSKEQEIIFTSGTTNGINLLASTLTRNIFKSSNVLISDMEHNSNIVPWLILKDKIRLGYIPLEGTDLNYLAAEQMILSKKPKIVSITHASNALGTINNIGKISKLCAEVDSVLIIDAAQSAPHMKIDFKKLGADFVCLSSHKMLGPTGSGILIGREDLLESMPEFTGGGNMVSKVSKTNFKCAPLPNKFEAGTQNISGVIGFGSALKYLQKVGFDKIEATQEELLKYSLKRAQEYPFINIVSNTNVKSNVGIITFNINGVHAHDISDFLSKYGVCIRAGQHCTHTLHSELDLENTARASFYFYNSKKDVDALFLGLEKLSEVFDI